MSERPCFVYFVQAGAGGRIKIGISRNVQNRLTKMRTDAAESLILLAVVPGDRAKEQSLHSALGAHRSNGEWFHPHADVLAAITREKARAGNVEYLIPKKTKEPKNALEHWRRAHGLTTEQVAKKILSTQATISRLENDKQAPSWPLMQAIFHLTGGEVTPNDFATWLRSKKAEVA